MGGGQAPCQCPKGLATGRGHDPGLGWKERTFAKEEMMYNKFAVWVGPPLAILGLILWVHGAIWEGALPCWFYIADSLVAHDKWASLVGIITAPLFIFLYSLPGMITFCMGHGLARSALRKGQIWEH